MGQVRIVAVAGHACDTRNPSCVRLRRRATHRRHVDLVVRSLVDVDHVSSCGSGSGGGGEAGSEVNMLRSKGHP